MKKIFSKTAFSLLELIIASVLVVIVVLGIFAVNSVLSSNNQDYGQRYFIKSATQITLNHILNNASEAIGSGTTITVAGNSYSDQGFLIGASGVGDQYSFCIHQDISPSQPLDSTNVNSPPSTPPYYNNSYPAITSDSRWLCYTWSPNTYQINYCAWPYYSTSSNQGATGCTSNANAQYLGTAFNNPAAYVAFTPASGFTITIQNCLNNSDLTNCNSSGTSHNPAENPEVQLSGTIYPSQEGMQQN